MSRAAALMTALPPRADTIVVSSRAASAGLAAFGWSAMLAAGAGLWALAFALIL